MNEPDPTQNKLARLIDPLDDLAVLHKNWDTALSYFQEYAQQSDDGFELLYMIAFRSTDLLNRIAKKKNETAKTAASNQSHWPILLGPNSRQFNDVAVFLKEIQLGEELPLQIPARQLFRTDTPTRKWITRALTAICDIKLVCALHAREEAQRSGIFSEQYLNEMVVPNSKQDWSELAFKDDSAFLKHFCSLPKLTKETADVWFPLIKTYVMHHTANRPEEDSDLRATGLYRINPKKMLDKEFHNTHIRDGIFTKLKQAFKNMLKTKKNPII